VDSPGIVPDKPIHQAKVEFLGINQLVQMVINVFFLDGFVESFDMGVHLGRFGISVEMDKIKPI